MGVFVFLLVAFVAVLHFYDIVFGIAIATVYVIEAITKVFNFIVDLHFAKTTAFNFTILVLFYSFLVSLVIYTDNKTYKTSNSKKYSRVSPKSRPSSPNGDRRDLMRLHDD